MLSRPIFFFFHEIIHGLKKCNFCPAELHYNHNNFFLNIETTKFDLDRGLLELIGPQIFRDIFGIHSREEIVKTSLTFVIDVTGSMSNDIKEAKRATKKIVIEAKDSQFVPENYVLVTFSDPGVYQTLDLLLSPFHN